MEPQPDTRLGRAFCSAHFRDVPVLVNDDTLVSCLEYGVRCTGRLCPLFDLPTLPDEQLLGRAMELERRPRQRGLPPKKKR